MTNEHPATATADAPAAAADSTVAAPIRRTVRRPGAGSVRHPGLRPGLRTRRSVTPTTCVRETAEVLDGTRLWRKADPGIELTVVMPFYNPGAALRRTVLRLVSCLRAEGVGFEVIAVSDGSTDGSERTIRGIGPEVRVIVNEVNEGKGAALHTGFARARGTWIGFVDADGDIDPAHLMAYLRIARIGRPDAVYADKRHAASASAATRLRKLISMVFSTLVTALFFLGIRDTQTGCKLFRRDVLAHVLPKLRERRFAFDLEFFVVAQAAGFQNLVPAPVRLNARMAGSSVTSGAIVRTVHDTFVIFTRRQIHHQYAPRAGVKASVTASYLRDVAVALTAEPIVGPAAATAA